MRKFLILNILIFVSVFAWENEVAVLKKVLLKNKGASIASSYLQDKDLYSSKNVDDGDLKTAWCTNKKPKGEFVAFKGAASEIIQSYTDLKKINYIYKAKLVIFNGYGKSEETYYNNNRIKKGTLKIYEARIGDALSGLFFEKDPTFVIQKELNFKDEPKLQIVDLNFELKDRPKEKQVDELGLFYIFTIDEVYNGKKYKDTCISKLKAYAIFGLEDEAYYKKMNGLQ
ncbi:MULTISPECIES: NADase-type glycan-binding domain-containing protein [Leptospira]|uniref:NADase-type glycan-binding domain-containing protein n=1 Tax=Leptospira TaxID=171 RepID=UPI0002926DBE|nr:MULTISPECIES: hypothetical protein [Leptospira]EKO77782.1 hypothetical protein LEP1GSC068_2847 [Leptospira sp. Fiocruz LV3954]EMI62755.1 hypothetical protein LEP1GSC076_3321 [Leptospira sp. Fiocruz LV4135]EMM77302.1 hypothetical protein LEP1GSC040_0024 [Leptospira santarosai str. 2000030832]EMO69913.1 hypothetical protein LEP1GSC130_3640 [Leptospira santarosai str. 200403458]EMO99724.1 hypothetical protein LEP1GSC120_3203 [Leptospira santarosai str. 200702252]